MGQKWKNGIALGLVPQLVLVNWFGRNPEWVEMYYSEGIYPIISTFLRRLTGWVPFSVGDLFYTMIVVLALRYLYRNRKSIKKKPLYLVRDFGMVLSIVFFVFHLYWGINYHRLPINEKLDFQVEYTREELTNFTLKILHTTNRLQVQLTNDSTQAVQATYTTKEIYGKTLEGYEHAAKLLPMLAYERPSLKSSLYSLPLTYMGYGGYFNPFTNEAQVNSKVPMVRLPSISAHEIGHQLGYASESSTNFIGLLVASVNPDPYFQYAAQSHGLAYCLSNLKTVDEKAYGELMEKLNPGVVKNYLELERFWANYENPTEPLFKAIFNAFLKANAQEDGIKSYSKVVGLLIGWDRKVMGR